MKWIPAVVLVGLALAVASGRLPAIWVVYTLSAVFIAMALALVFAYSRTRHNGLLLMGVSYGASAILAIVVSDWWPLAVGFVIVWIMRAMGLDPGPEPMPSAQSQDAPPDSDNKN